ncbi:MAG: FAD-dependent monooxygenase [Pseudomonadota bacterium]
MDLNGLDCIVIGAGVGGLATALVLARHGAHVRVLEQAAQVREVGAGLQISPNGFVVLNALGLGDALRAVSVRGEAVQMRGHMGRPVLRVDLSPLPCGDYHFLHRADLIDILAAGARAAGIDILLDQKVAAVVPGETPGVTDQDGQTRNADLVIGADGLHSVARIALNGTSAPFFTRQVAWRAVVPETGAAPEVDVYMGPHRHVVSYPLRGGKMRNIVAVQERADWAAESWSQEDDPQNLRAVFADFGAPVQALLSRVDKVNLWGLFRHPVARNWHADGVALVGDAAHPTLPFMAQGANMALEDAWALGRMLASDGPLESRLSRYQAMRHHRVERVVATANRNAKLYHLAFPPVRWAVQTGMRLCGAIAPGRMVGQFDWIYGYDVTQA